MTELIILHFATGLAFLVVTLAVQGASHFALNKAHYAAIGHLRPDPIIPLGLSAALIQGVLISVALQVWKGEAAGTVDALIVSGGFGLFLTTYISLAEPAKYKVPHIPRWIRAELSASVLQFLIFGFVLAFVHGTMREFF